ncbi:hypothetical protein [Glycomyces endophyticus]
MTITLPDWLTEPMSWTGFEFPTADEDKIAELGTAWTELAGTLRPLTEQAAAAAAEVWGESSGDDIEAFQTWWEGPDSPKKSLEEGVEGALVAGQALQLCALIVIALKIHIIVELVAAVIAIIAAAVAGGGAGAAVAAAVKTALKEAVGALIEHALTSLLEG